MSNSDHRGEILWIGAANYPDDIDAALKRPGRFDLVLPFLLPDEPSRAQILEVLLSKRLSVAPGARHAMSDEDFRVVAAATDGYSGAELAAIIQEVLRVAVRQRASTKTLPPIDLRAFEAVLRRYRPAPGAKADYKKMSDQARNAVSFEDMFEGTVAP